MADPISLSAIFLVASKAVAITGRMLEAFKENRDEVPIIQVQLDSIRKLQKYAERKWKKHKTDDEVLLKGIKEVKRDLKKLEKNDTWMKMKVVMGISPGVREELKSISEKINFLMQNLSIQRLNESLDQSDRTDLLELQKLHNRDVKRLQENLAKELSDDKFEQVGELTKEEYDDYVKGGVYVRNPCTKFPCTDLIISKSVPKCTKLILKFLKRHNENFNKIHNKTSFHRSNPLRPRNCLEKVFAEILPKELKKTLRLLHRPLSHDAALLFHSNIKRLRQSLANPQFKKIRDGCESEMNLSKPKWNKHWDELYKESEKLLKPQVQQSGQQQGHHGQHNQPQHGRHQGPQQREQPPGRHDQKHMSK